MPSPLHKLAIISWWCPIRDAGAAVGQEGGSKKMRAMETIKNKIVVTSMLVSKIIFI